MKTQKIHKKHFHNKTKKPKPALFGRQLKSNNHGWKEIEIRGSAKQRGFAHGYLLHEELTRLLFKFPFIVKHELDHSYKKYLKVCKKVILPIVQTHYQEFYQEIEGIVEGYQHATSSINLTVDILIAWNAIMSMYEYCHNKPQNKKNCSAFLATGSYTKNQEIVMGHTTHTELVSASLFNIIIYMIPDKGIPFVMQTAPGCIASGTDWFITKNHIIGCETTISEISYKPQFDDRHHPYFCRIRQAMQYGKTLDDYARIMTTNNSGDYASSWLFGDVRSNEIMICELGLNITNVQRTKDGVYYGMNSAMSNQLRSKETHDDEFYDIRSSSGSRNYRFQELLQKYHGKLDVGIAKKIVADHYSVSTNKNEPRTTSICVHSYNDPNIVEPFYPHGCTDGKVVDSDMAKKFMFEGRFGPCCGIPFYVKPYIKKNPKYKVFEPYLDDFPHQPWTKLQGFIR